jgi:hypothetical protein
VLQAATSFKQDGATLVLFDSEGREIAQLSKTDGA